MAANVDIIIRAQNQASGAIGQVQRDLGGLERAASGVSRGLSGLQSAVMGIGVGAAVAGIGALTAGLAKSVNVAADFESQMNILGVAARSSGTAVNSLSDAALRVGSDTQLVGVSASEAADAMTNFYKAGLSTNEIFNDLQGYLSGTTSLGGALRSAVDLAAASELDLAAASDVVAISMATFGLSAGDATRVADTLVQAADASLASVGGLSEGLVNVGPVAASMGMSLEDVSTALAILSTRGIQGSEAGTAMRSMLLNLQRPTKAVQTALDELDVSLFNADGTMRDLPAIIGSLETAMAGLTEEQRNQYATTLAGTYGLAAFQTLVSEGAAGWESMTNAIENASSAQQIAAARTNGFNAAMEQLWGSIETFMISVGTPLIQVFLTPAIQAITAIVGELSKFAPSVDDVEAALSAMLATGQQVLTTISGFVSPIIEAVGAFVSWKDILIVLASVAASIVIPALVGIMAAAAPVIAVFAALVGAVALVRTAWENNWGGIQEKTAAAVEAIKGVLGGFGETLTALGKYFAAVVEDGDVLNDWLTHLPGWIQPAVEWLGRLTAAAIELAGGGSLADFGATLNDLFSIDMSGWIATLTNAVETVRTTFEEATAWIGERWTALQATFASGDTSWSGMWTELSTVLSGVGDSSTTATENITAFVTALTGSEETAATVTAALGSIGAAVGTVRMTFEETQTAISTFTASDAWTTASETITSSLGEIGTALQEAFSGEISLRELQTTLVTEVTGIGTAVQGVLQSEAFTQFGANLLAAFGLETLPTTISEKLAEVQTALQPLGEFLTPVFERLKETFGGLGEYFTNFGTQIEPVKAAASELVTAFSPLAEAIGGLFSGGSAGSPSVAAAVFAGALSLALNVLNGLASAVQPLISGVLAELTTILSGLATIVSGLTTAIGGMISGDTEAVWAGLGTAVQGVADILTGTLSNALTVVGGLLSAIGTTITGTLSDWGFDAAAASVQGVIDKVTSVIDLLAQLASGEVSINAVMPEWLTSLTAWTWPEWSAPEWLTSLTAWTWPEWSAPTWLASLFLWAWPELPGVPKWVSDLIAWAWPGLPSAPGWLTSLLSWAWPGLPAVPNWLDTLLVWAWPSLPSVPGWLTDLLSWEWPSLPSFPALPSWLGGASETVTPGNNAAGTAHWRGGLTWVGEAGRELVQLPRGSRIYNNRESEQMVAAGGNVTVYATVSSAIDVEMLAYRVADVLARA